MVVKLRIFSNNREHSLSVYIDLIKHRVNSNHEKNVRLQIVSENNEILPDLKIIYSTSIYMLLHYFVFRFKYALLYLFDSKDDTFSRVEMCSF